MSGTREQWRRRFCYLSLLMVVGHFILTSEAVTTEWWALGVSTCGLRGAPDCPDCSQLRDDNVLTNDQQEICRTMGDATVKAVSQGTRRAIIDCQDRFSNRRWNCSTFYGDHLFGNFVNQGTRETAVLYAYMSAGSTVGVAEACHRRRIRDCPCVLNGTNGQQDEEGNVILYDCNDNVNWALDFTLEFAGYTNTPRTNTVREMMDLHNNDVGRMAVNNRTISCVCHGISGTCAVKTCYLKAPDMGAIGEKLRGRYDSAIGVVKNNETGELVPILDEDPPTMEDLVFTGPSLDFCDPDQANGILGTEDRQCDPNPLSSDSCQVMCCGRGHYTRTYTVPVEQCRFVWCCRIECSVVGNDTVVEYRCR